MINLVLQLIGRYSSIEVENTLDSFDAATDAEYVDYIELDVRLTADGKLVTVHNNIIVSEDGKLVVVSDSNYSDILGKQFKYYSFNIIDFCKSFVSDTEGNLIKNCICNLSGKSYTITDLKSALKVCNGKKILLDLKFQNDFDNFVPALMEVLFSENVNNNTIIQSSDLILLEVLQSQYPQCNYLAVIKRIDDFKYCGLFKMLGVKKNLIDAVEVDEAISNGKVIFVWTINTTDELEKVVDSLGDYYDDIIYVTDYPDVVGSHLKTISMQKKKVTTE